MELERAIAEAIAEKYIPGDHALAQPTSLQLAAVAMTALKAYLSDEDVLGHLEAELDYESVHGTVEDVVTALLRTAEGDW